MKLTPPALFSATKSDFTESATSFKLFKVREGPDFISGFTLCASSSSFSGVPVVAEVLREEKQRQLTAAAAPSRPQRFNHAFQGI